MEVELPIADLLRDLGFDTPAAQAAARSALHAANLTNPRKQNIRQEKRPRVEELLRATFLVTCGAADCSREAQGRQLLVAEDRGRCWICGGSDNRRAMEQAAALFRSRGISKIVVVGGSPGVHEQLRQLTPPDLQIKIVDGTERQTGDAARSDLRWADLVLVWGSSELNHKVSEHYTGSPAHSDRVVRVTRRGIAALLEEAMRWARQRP